MISNPKREETLELYYEILDNMIKDIPDKYDVSEGSVFRDLISPSAKEIALALKELEDAKLLLSVENHSGESLDRWVKEITGQKRRAGTKATGEVFITGKGGTVVEKGTLVASDTAVFEVIEETTLNEDGEAVVPVQCLDVGEVGNIKEGYINRFPVTIHGLETVTNLSDFTNGYEEEDDDSLRTRYYEHLRLPATSGNKAHYELWAKEVVGVGDVKVNPLWNGAGTVQLVIIDSNKNEADEELLEKVFEHIEEKRPIGATVTVSSAKVKEIAIEVNVKLADGYELEDVREEFEKNLEAHRKEIAFLDSYVSHAQVGNILINTKGILDYEDLRLDGLSKNIPLESDEVPKFDLLKFTQID